MGKVKVIMNGLIKENPTFVLLLGMCPTLGTTTSAINGMFLPSLYETLGLFIPLIVVNCIVLGRAEAYANKHSVMDSACDGIGIGLGFTLALTILGLVREILGSGSVFGMKFISGDGMLAFILAPGAFIVLGYLIVIFKRLTAKIKM